MKEREGRKEILPTFYAFYLELFHKNLPIFYDGYIFNYMKRKQMCILKIYSGYKTYFTYVTAFHGLTCGVSFCSKDIRLAYFDVFI